MKSKQLQGGKQPKLTPTEWFFAEIPKPEIEACFRFEYARELAKRCRRIKDLLAEFKAGQGAPKGTAARSKGWKAQLQLVEIMRACFPHSLIVFDQYFPAKPWQVLDQEMREAMVEYLNETLELRQSCARPWILSIRTVRELGPDERTIRMFQHLHEFLSEEDFSQTEYGFVSINWNHAGSAIKRAFAEWLSEQLEDRKKRGLPIINYQSKTGRGGPADRLNALGALRVVDYCSAPDELSGYTTAKARYKAYYSNVRELREAAEKAAKLLDMLLVQTGN